MFLRRRSRSLFFKFSVLIFILLLAISNLLRHNALIWSWSASNFNEEKSVENSLSNTESSTGSHAEFKLFNRSSHLTEKTEEEIPELSFGPPFVSPYSRRRFIAAVTTLRQTYTTNLKRFKNSWKKVWPGLHFKVSMSFLNNEKLSGMALLSTTFEICGEALLFGGNFDYLIIMEDGAAADLLASWPVSNRPNDLDYLLALLEKVEGAGLLLGGAGISGYDSRLLQRYVLPKGIIKAESARANYAIILPKKNLERIANYYAFALRNKKNEHINVTDQTWDVWKQIGSGGYVAAPALVVYDKRSTSFEPGHERAGLSTKDWWRDTN